MKPLINIPMTALRDIEGNSIKLRSSGLLTVNSDETVKVVVFPGQKFEVTIKYKSVRQALKEWE